MQKLNNKLFVVLVTSIIISSGITTISAIDIKNNNISTKEKITDTNIETVTLFRYGLDGSIEQIEIEIEVDKKTDIAELIEEKCQDLIEDDIEFQNLLTNNSKLNFLSKIRSRGRGIHFKIAPQILWPVKFKLFPLLPPYIFRRVKIPIIYCRYPRDQYARTEITPLIGGNTNTTEGYHSVLSVGFYGFKWWIGSVSFLGFLFRTGFVGFSILTRTREL